MQKMNLVVGQKIRGYGLLNEFGEFDFIPEQTGIRQGETKLIRANDDFTLSETKKKILVHMRITKGDNKLDVLREYLRIMNLVLTYLKDYDF